MKIRLLSYQTLHTSVLSLTINKKCFNKGQIVNERHIILMRSYEMNSRLEQ